ncbi:MAG: STAS domain-containing protein [Gammaproteobacteria bacterium]|nr:STAS domain-containing protein [Gammaproteobacteria bacterium]
MHNSGPTSFVEEMIDELLTDHSVEIAEDIVENSTDKDNPLAINNEDSSMDSIQLSGECTIYEIAQIHQKIHDNWQANTNLSLDVSAVTEVDASFIQLLASCKKMALDKNQSFELLNPSDAVSNKMTAMFMNDYFNLENTADQ